MTLDAPNQTWSLKARRRFRTLTYNVQTHRPDDAGLILHTSLKKRDAIQLAELLQLLHPKSVLEIGSYCGISANWILSTLPDVTLECVDPWPSGGWINVEAVFDQLVLPYRNRVTKTKGYLGCRNNQAYSVTNNCIDTRPGDYDRHMPIVVPSRTYDLVYVDGDHRTSSSINAFMLLKEYTSHLIYHDANLPTHRAAFDIILREWAGEWTVVLFADGEDGLAMVMKAGERTNQGTCSLKGRTPTWTQ